MMLTKIFVLLSIFSAQAIWTKESSEGRIDVNATHKPHTHKKDLRKAESHRGPITNYKGGQYIPRDKDLPPPLGNLRAPAGGIDVEDLGDGKFKYHKYYPKLYKKGQFIPGRDRVNAPKDMWVMVREFCR
mmetsp:Transcript_18325/g.27447  ORF Transcript_18325/g.27447 Transcript_18325/m.27447 type:complete len:130 (-) Transcript_18325:16-405(-)